MPQEKGELRLFIDDFKAHVREMGKDMAKKLGTIKEPISTEEQMEAWKVITPEELLTLTDKYGTEKVSNWIKEMKRREAISNGYKKPL